MLGLYVIPYFGYRQYSTSGLLVLTMRYSKQKQHTAFRPSPTHPSLLPYSFMKIIENFYFHEEHLKTGSNWGSEISSVFFCSFFIESDLSWPIPADTLIF